MNRIMKDLISVIVPVYRTEKYLRRCIDSILRQTYKNLEIILVDDGSDDGAPLICDEYAHKDQRIQVIHKKNGGLSSSRNAGLDKAVGKYIAFIDSDDFIANDYVETLYREIKKKSAEFSKIDYKEVYDEKQICEKSSKQSVIYEGEKVEEAYFNLRIDSVCVFLYSRNLIGDTRFIQGVTSEDIPFNFEIFSKAQKLVYIPTVKYYYYHNPKSISNGKFNKNMINYLLFRKQIYEYCRSEKKRTEKKAEILYARAAMGLMARMAIYGIEDELEEDRYKKIMRKAFKPHKKAFFSDRNTELSRKLLAILVFDFYPVATILRRVAK